MSRGLIPALIFAFSGIIFFGLGNLLAALNLPIQQALMDIGLHER